MGPAKQGQSSRAGRRSRRWRQGVSIGRAVGRTSASASAGSRPGPSATAGRQGVGVVVGGRSVASDESGVCRAEDSRDGGRQIFCRYIRQIFSK